MNRLSQELFIKLKLGIRFGFFLAVLLITLPLSVNAQVENQPANSYISGSNWYCDSGYFKDGYTCNGLFKDFPGGAQPANSYISGSSWYCDSG